MYVARAGFACIHLMSAQVVHICQVFSDRRVEALVMRFVNCKSPKERQDVFGDLAVQAANVHKSVLAVGLQAWIMDYQSRWLYS